MAPRAELLARTFVDVADTLVADFDVVDFLTTADHAARSSSSSCRRPACCSPIPAGRVNVAASSSHRMELLELFELQHDEGPCLDCYRTGEPVRCPDLTAAGRTLAPVRTGGGRTGLRLRVRASDAVARLRSSVR